MSDNNISTVPVFSASANSNAEIPGKRVEKILRDYNRAFYAANKAEYSKSGIVFDPNALAASAIAGLSPAWKSFALAAQNGSGACIGDIAAKVTDAVDTGKKDGDISLNEVIAWNAESASPLFAVSKGDEAFNLLAGSEGFLSEASLKSFFGAFKNAQGRVAVGQVRALSGPRQGDALTDFIYFPNLVQQLKDKDQPDGAKPADLAWRVISDYDDEDADFADAVIDYKEAEGLRRLWDEAAKHPAHVALLNLADTPL